MFGKVELRKEPQTISTAAGELCYPSHCGARGVLGTIGIGGIEK